MEINDNDTLIEDGSNMSIASPFLSYPETLTHKGREDKNDEFLNMVFKLGKKWVDKNGAKCNMVFGCKTKKTPVLSGKMHRNNTTLQHMFARADRIRVPNPPAHL